MNEKEITSGGKIFSLELLNRINRLVIESSEISRTEVARRVCEWQEWRNPYGEVQLSSCISALKSLEERGHVELPIATRKGPGFSLRLREESVEAAREVPLRVDDVEGLSVPLQGNPGRRVAYANMEQSDKRGTSSGAESSFRPPDALFDRLFTWMVRRVVF